MSGGHPRWLALLSLVIALVCLDGGPATAQDDPPDPGPQPGAIGEPPAPLTEKRLYDVANLLDNDQEAEIESEASRLARHGMPSLVIVQASPMTPEQAAALAADVRRGWGVETAAGADDGLVILVTVDLSDEKRVFTVLSWGDHALPHFGIDSATADRIQRDWLDAYLQEGMFFEAIDYSLRRFIYHSIYDPAPQEPLSDTRETIGTVVSWLAPLAAIVGGTLAYMTSRSSGAGRIVAPTSLATWGIPLAAMVAAVLAVWSRSEPGVVAALALLAIALLDWVRRDPARARKRRIPGATHGRVTT